jgi:hypothetical protein
MYYEKVYSGTMGLEGYKTAYFGRFRGFWVYSDNRDFIGIGVKVVYKPLFIRRVFCCALYVLESF